MKASRVQRKSKPLVKRIYEPVYRFELLFIAGCSLEDANKELYNHYINPISSDYKDSQGLTFKWTSEDNPKSVKQGAVYCIWISDKKDFYCLMHEVSHLIIKVFEEKCIDISSETTEAFAYYQEFWFKRLWEEVSK